MFGFPKDLMTSLFFSLSPAQELPQHGSTSAVVGPAGTHKTVPGSDHQAKSERPPRSCRHCGAALERLFVDLGMSPLANAFLSKDQLGSSEKFYPLQAYVCGDCLLVQLEEFESPDEIFSDYAYFSSYSESWLRHAREYVDLVCDRFGLAASDQVIEVASNDGYLLQYFQSRGIPVLGIDPAANIASTAEAKGIRTIVKFFGVQTARELIEQDVTADLLIGNNVLAHVPDIHDFVGGVKVILKSTGIVTMEFPHILQLIRQNQFDTIYHEHFCYFSLLSVSEIFRAHGLTLFDVEEIPTHGGSLRIFVKHDDAKEPVVSDRVAKLRETEIAEGLGDLDIYSAFSDMVKQTKRHLLTALSDIKNRGKSIVAYGGAAKGNTLLNYCGIGTDFIEYAVDLSPHKQGLFLPGTHIPILHPDKISETRPDYVLILPWNLKEEIMSQLAYIREWGGKFIVPIPEVKIY